MSTSQCSSNSFFLFWIFFFFPFPYVYVPTRLSVRPSLSNPTGSAALLLPHCPPSPLSLIERLIRPVPDDFRISSYPHSCLPQFPFCVFLVESYPHVVRTAGTAPPPFPLLPPSLRRPKPCNFLVILCFASVFFRPCLMAALPFPFYPKTPFPFPLSSLGRILCLRV